MELLNGVAQFDWPYRRQARMGFKYDLQLITDGRTKRSKMGNTIFDGQFGVESMFEKIDRGDPKDTPTVLQRALPSFDQ